MSEYIGNVEIPEIASSGTWPLVTDYPHRMERDYRVVVHTFGAGNLKREQRFLIGTGARRFTWQRRKLTRDNLNTLKAFWEARQGPYQPFTYNAPTDDGASTTSYTVRFAREPFTFEALQSRVSSAGVVMLEIPSSAPTYSINATVTRFPSSTLNTALLNQEQVIFPLIKIQPVESGYPAIYLSDRRCTVGGQLYQARLTQWDGISQTIGSAADSARFTFGDADNVMTLLSADTYLFRASIEFSLFHVGTGIKLDLWKGEIVDWANSEASAEFTVSASDGFHELRLPYPTRKFTRTCWKKFNDGNACPYSSAGSLNGSYPSASGASCDKGPRTPNGCDAHNMLVYFGGTPAEPQGVNVKDNSTGTWGFGRSPLHSTSIVNDGLYDKVVPEVYTDTPMPVPCQIAAGRDEGDFYEALMAVCEGPITFGTGHRLDGQYHHGYPGSLGLRAIPGNTPAGSTDFFSLDQSGNQVGSDPNKIYSGSSTYLNQFAAGLAAIVLRRADEKGLQLSRPTDHAGEAIVSGGLQGWVWSGAGSRTLQTLTNPIWIVVNMMLRARGLRFANAATCEQYFDVAAAVAAAAICDDDVDKIAGMSGTETQFKFIGAIREEKPLRDWIDEVLKNCLGYYTFAFGKLRLGIRSNSSSGHAFTTGNVLDRSVSFTPKKTSFNEISVVFADEAYNFATNNVTIAAEDHQALIGGSTASLRQAASLNLVGTANASQAARIGATVLKEELGGANLAEWKNARNVTYKTTVLSLATEPGMVCSITHEKAPGGAMEFRKTGWRLNSDYSIDCEGVASTDSMYDAVEGPKPADVVPSAIPPELIAYPRRPSSPATARSSTDPLADANFFNLQVAESYETRIDGSVQAYAEVLAFAPRNRFLDVPPPIVRGITQAATGGSLPAGRNYFVAVCPYQGTQWGPPSNTVAIAVPAGASAALITLPSVTWPEPPSGSWDGYRVLVGNTESSMCALAAVVGSSLPSSLTVASMRVHSEGASPNFVHARAKAKLVYSPGIMRAKVTAVTSSTIVCSALAGGGDNFAGRYVTWAQDASDGVTGQSTWNFLCTSYAESTGTFTFATNPSSAGVEPGDQIYVRWQATSATSATITDSGANWSTDEHVGRRVRILWGTGRGQVRSISANSGTALSVEPAWSTTPSTDSIFIIEEPEWLPSVDSSAVDNMSGHSYVLAVPVENRQVPILIALFGVDIYGQESPEEEAPVRDLFFGGEGFLVNISGDYAADPNDRIIVADTTGGDVEITVPSTGIGRGRLLVKNAAGSNTVTLVADDAGDTLEVDTLAAGETMAIFPDAEQATWRSEGIGGSGGSGAGSTLKLDVALVAGPGTTTVSRTVVTDADLVVRIRQHASGQREVAWSSDFRTGTPVDIRMGANEETIFRFTEFDGEWCLTSPPVHPTGTP